MIFCNFGNSDGVNKTAIGQRKKLYRSLDFIKSRLKCSLVRFLLPKDTILRIYLTSLQLVIGTVRWR